MGYPWKIDKYQLTAVQTSTTHFQQWNKTDKAEKRSVVQEEKRREVKAARISRVVELENKEPGRYGSYHNAGSRGQTYGRWTSLELPSC